MSPRNLILIHALVPSIFALMQIALADLRKFAMGLWRDIAAVSNTLKGRGATATANAGFTVSR